MTSSKRFASQQHLRRRNDRRRRQPKQLSMELLQAREMLAADFMWQGDRLQINGTDGNDFVAVQHDALGIKVFTSDAVFREHEGRAFDSATSITVAGGNGNDQLISYQAPVPVTLFGEAGADFLYSSNPSDVLTGGDGVDWVHGQENSEHWDDAFGIPGLALTAEELQSSPSLDDEGRFALNLDYSGQTEIGEQPIAVGGSAKVSHNGLEFGVSGNVEAWDDAFGIVGFDLSDATLSFESSAGDVSLGGYVVGIDATWHAAGTSLDIEATVEVGDDLTTVEFLSSVQAWDNAFGIPELQLTNANFQGSGWVDTDNQSEFSLGVQADMLMDETTIQVAGEADVTSERVDLTLFGSVHEWDHAFGIRGLTLNDSQLQVSASSYLNNSENFTVALTAEMVVGETEIDVMGELEIAPDYLRGDLQGSVDDWQNAFGIPELNLVDSNLQVQAYSNYVDDSTLHIGLMADMFVDDKAVAVDGDVTIANEEIDVQLMGSVHNWTNAFGIEGLLFGHTVLDVAATRDALGSSSLDIGVVAEMQVQGQVVDVAGHLNVGPDSIAGSLHGVVAGEWSNAFGLPGLDLINTTITVNAISGPEEMAMMLTLDAGIELFGTYLGVSGTVQTDSEETVASLSAVVDGEWMDAFSIPGLQLQDTAISLAGTSGPVSQGLDIQLDTDLFLFGGYVDVIGDLGMTPTGVNITFSPPGTLDFVDMLGIPGLSLENADLLVSTGTDGLNASVFATMDMGNVAVGLQGDIAIQPGEVSANLTGRVHRWDNAFAIPGLNLDDVVLTLGVEADSVGGRMHVGLGAGIQLGASRIDVAGLVGFGSTGWELAFRGETDSLSSEDVISFANTITQAGEDPLPQIPEDAVGDVEIRDAFINFAPRGGNVALGIEDGFGIGGVFYVDGKLLAGGAFAVDLEQKSFDVGLNIPKLDLGPVDLSDVEIDIRVAATDSHFLVQGSAQLMGVTVFVQGQQYSDGTFLLTGTGSLNFDGMAAQAVFTVDRSGIYFEAMAEGSVVNAIKGTVTDGVNAVFGGAQEAIDKAQAAVDAGQAEVRNLERELEEARAEAQEEVDEVKEKIAAAESLVSRAKSSKDYWYRQRKSRYDKWRSAKSDTARAPWYKKPYYKSIEAAKYSSYAYSVTVYATKVAAYKAADAALDVIQSAAGWALDSVGVEANPEVIRLKALIAASKVGLGAADLLLEGVEEANSHVLRAIEVVDSLRVDRIVLRGRVGSNSGFAAAVDVSFAGKQHSFDVQIQTGDIVKEIAGEIKSAILPF